MHVFLCAFGKMHMDIPHKQCSGRSVPGSHQTQMIYQFFVPPETLFCEPWFPTGPLNVNVTSVLSSNGRKHLQRCIFQKVFEHFLASNLVMSKYIIQM